MSTSTPTTVGSSSGTLTTANSTSPLQITGLASGLNTNAIISAELAEAELPITNMQTQVAGLQTEDNTLTSFQSMLQTVQLDAQALGDPSLFQPTQTITSSDSSIVRASSTTGIGGVIGGSTVTVSQLATAAQRTFNFTSPTSADTITVDGTQVAVQAGASITDLVNSINSDSGIDVWAATNSNGQLVLSSRSTGNQCSFNSVDDPGSTIVEDTTLAANGQDAQYTINGQAGSSPSDTVSSSTSGATLTLAGVTLNLSGVTGSNPVTVNVEQPAADTQSIATAVNQLVTDYNSAISAMNSTISTEPANSASGGTYNPDGGSLYGDPDLETIVANMRTAMYTPLTGLPTDMSSLSEIGINTGHSTGIAEQSSIAGTLTVNASQLDQAIESNPNGVQQLLEQWSQSMFTQLSNVAGPTGVLASRINGNGSEVTSLNQNITTMQAVYAQEQKTMQEEWASVESTLSQLQSQGSAFSSSYSAYTGGSSSTSSSSDSSSSSSS